MNRSRSFLPCALLLLAGWAVLPADDKPAPGKSTLARQVVRLAAGARENDLVHLWGTPGDVVLLEEIAVEARKLGAHPLLTLTSDRMRRRFIVDVPEKFDTQPPRFDLALAGLADVFIFVEAGDEGALVGVPAARMTAQQKAAEPVSDKMLKRSVRTVALGNGLYPLPARAKRFGLTAAQLREVYEAGLATDPAVLVATGARLQKALAVGKELHLRSDDGTDLKMRIAGRPVFASDGVLTPEKVKKGGAAVSTWLPAGEVFLAPLPGSGEGTIVAPVAFWEGQEIRKLRLTFKAGKLAEMSAESGLDRLRKVYAAHGPGKEQLGAIDIGINPGVKAPAGSKLVSYVAIGTVTVMLGANTWAGGDVSIAFGLPCHLPGCTLSVDGKPIVESGRLAP